MSRRLHASGHLLLLLSGPGALHAEQAWSAGDSDIVLSEIHYHPPEGEAKEEFLELYNAGVRWVDVGGWTFSQGIDFTIPQGTLIAPGAFLVVARDSAALRASRSIENVTGDFKGSLSNTGEIVELRDRSGRAVLSVRYGDGDGGLWPDRADGEGPSLELLEPDPDGHRAGHWGSSRVPGGTPGRASSRGAWPGAGGTPRAASEEAAPPSLRINEARLDEAKPFVEILNEGAGTQSLSGLKLTRDLRGEGGVILAGTIAKKKLFVFEGEPARPLAAPGSRTLFLLRADSREIIDSFPLGKSLPAEASAGRFPDGGGDVFVFEKATPGAPNPRPPPPDLVIHEILYHGPEDPQKKSEEEFIEIHNRGKSPVALKGWKIERATSFEFPDTAAIPAGGYAVVSSDPEKLRARLAPPEAKLVFGPLKGKLSNSGESIALVDPRGNVADRVHYRDRPPWPSGADGGGASLELLSTDLDNRWPQAWTLGPAGGTPCRKNERSVKTMAPAIAGVRHEPAVPGPDDEVAIHAHVLDTGALSEVAVVFRDASTGSRPAKKAMSDTGQVDDGAAKDGHYAVRLPRFRAGTLVGFYIQARDSSGKVTRFPEGDRECHFQVEPRATAPGGPRMPVYRILMPRETWDRFVRTSSMQDTKFPCTFIATMEGRGSSDRRGLVHYGASIRYRGHASRMPRDGRFSYRLELAPGDLFDGRDRLILNAVSPERQKVGSDLLRLSGVPASDVALIRLKTPGIDDARYVDVEVVNNEFLDRRYGTSAGAIYRARTQGGRGSADLSYRGPDPEPYLQAYEPANKKAGQGIRALIRAIEALDTKDDALYAQKVEQAIDAPEWAAYFAVNHVLMNDETTLCNGVPDDYFIAQRPTDGKIILVAWDQDSFFTRRRSESIFGPGVPAVRRFLQHPRFAPLYHRAIRALLDGPLSRTSLEWRLSYLRGSFPEEELASMEDFAAWRQGVVRDRYLLWPQATLQVEGRTAQGAGFGTRIFVPPEAGQEVTLAGFADPAVAFKVKAAGDPAAYDAVTGRWSLRHEAGSLAAGSNPLWVELLGARDEVEALYSINLEKAPAPRVVQGEVSGKAAWKAGAPYLLQGEVVVAPGATLRLGAGVNVVCAAGSALTVRGTLAAEGTPAEPVTFRPADWGRSWSGLRLLGAASGSPEPRHSLAYCRFEGGRAGAAPDGELQAAPDGALVEAQRTSLLLDHCLFRGIQGAALACDGASVDLRALRIADGRSGIVARGGALRVDGAEISRLRGDGLRAAALEKDSAVKASTFRDILGSAIAIDGSKVTLESVLACGCTTGLAIAGGSKVRASHATLVGCGTGVALDRTRAPARRAPGGAVLTGGGGAGGRSSLELVDSVLGIENEHIASGAGSQAVISRSVVAPARIAAEAPRGDGLVFALPRFADPRRGDFRLAKGGPGQGAAANGADFGFASGAGR